MIRPLRRRHRHFFYALGALLPIGVMVGLAMRKPSEVWQEEALPLTAPRVDTFSYELWTDTQLWTGLPMVFVRLLADTPVPTVLAVELSITDILTKPDLLVYWSAEVIPADGGLSENAYLLGTFYHVAPTIYPLPAEALKVVGYLALYSPAYGKVVASAALKR